MFIRKSRTNSPVAEMSAVVMARALERHERESAGSVPRARLRLAEKLKVGVGTVENLVRGRVKGNDATIRDRLQALLIREWEREIARLTHELHVARQIGSPLAGEQVSEIEAHLAKAKALIAATTIKGGLDATQAGKGRS